jgi:hypothetical protein
MQKLISAVALSLLAPAAIAQCSISGTGTPYGSGDDFIANGGAGIDIGFAFPIGGTTYQFIHPSSNGFIRLSDGTVTLTNSDFSPTEAEFLAEEARIAPLWQDNNLIAANNGGLFVDTSVANQCTVTWMNAVRFGQTSLFNFSCTFYVSGQVDFSYGTDIQLTQSGTLIVGMTPGNGAVSPGAVDLSAGVPTTDDTTFEQFAANSFDMSSSQLLMIATMPGYVPVLNGPIVCASKLTYGVGCGAIAGDARYELFPLSTIDICGTGTAITFLYGGGTYTVLDSIPGAYVAPTAGTVISAGDDAFGLVPLSIPMPTVNGTTSALQVCTNGFIALSANTPGPADYSPTAAEFAGFTQPTICGPWYDYSPNAGGQLVYEEIAGIMYVTWDAVPAFGVAAATDTVQYQFDLATGNCTIVYQSTVFGGASAWHTPLFGYTSGLGQTAIAEDMSAILPTTFQVGGGQPALSVDSNNPALGTNWDITTSGIEALSPIAITFLGNAQFTIPMTAIGFNAPGCDVNINTILGSLNAVNVGGTGTVSIPVPNNPALTGGILTAQSVCITLQNPALLLTSNGVQGTFGN